MNRASRDGVVFRRSPLSEEQPKRLELEASSSNGGLSAMPAQPLSHVPWAICSKLSGRAIHNSDYLCGVNASHFSFVARTTKKNFVEAHHLIPVQFQEKFKFRSLAVRRLSDSHWCLSQFAWLASGSS